MEDKEVRSGGADRGIPQKVIGVLSRTDGPRSRDFVT